MKKIISFFCCAVLGGAAHADTPDMQAYYKDSQNNRVMSFQIVSTVTAEQARTHASQQPHTGGQVTTVYYYRPGQNQPRNGFNTAANSYNHAQALIDRMDPPSFAAMRYLNGNFEFVECASEKSWLCRNE